MVPVAGSAYTYAYATLGELFAWIIGWDLILEYAVGSATVANGWSGYFQSVLAKFGLRLPAALAGPPIIYDTAAGHFVQTGGVVNLPAILIVAIVTVVLVKGIQESATLQRGDGGPEGRRGPLRHRRRRLLRQPGELAAVRALRADAASASSGTR